MTLAYEDILLKINTLDYFEQLLEILGPDKRKLDTLNAYANLYFGFDSEKTAIHHIKQEIRHDSQSFFGFVSNFLAEFPDDFLQEDLNRIVEGIQIEVESQLEYLKVTQDGWWIRRLALTIDQPDLEYESLSIPWRSPEKSDIVPLAIYDYLKSAVVCYRAGLHQGAVIMAAIAFEACLRQILEIKNQNKKDEPYFKAAKAQIEANYRGEEIQLNLKIDGAQKDLKSYLESEKSTEDKSGLKQLSLHITKDSRSIASGSSNPRLIVKTNPDNVPFLSSDETETKSVTAHRFEQFNERADSYGYFKAVNFPLDSAEIVRAVRNKLVHWEERHLDKKMKDGLVLREHIHDKRRVQKTLHDLADFISKLYSDLE